MPAPRASLLVIFVTVFIDLLGFGMVLPLLPIYAQDFAAQLGLHEGDWQIGALIGGLMSSFSIMQFVFAPWWGRLSDRIGRRPVIMVGLAGSVVFYALFGVATVFRSIVLLFVARIGAGIAGATISTAQAYIADTTTLENRAKGMALIGAAFGLGFALGPLFGYLALPAGKGDPGPGPGYAAAALSAVALCVAWFKLPESWQPTGEATRRRLLDFQALADALRTPSVGLLLLTNFVCVFSFANFESTLSLLAKDERGAFRFSFGEVCLMFAFVGFTLLVVQGGIVRRLAGRIAEATLAAAGAAAEIGGFVLLAGAAQTGSLAMLLAALAVVVSGFAFITPSINALVSRRSDPTRQGGILGVLQSTASLARVVGPLAGNVLFQSQPTYPLWLAAALMAGGLLMIGLAARRGADYRPATPDSR